jgi:hypothetical protein
LYGAISTVYSPKNERSNQPREKNMKILSKSEIKELFEIGQEPCISIYMPTHRSGNRIQEDPIRLKNILNTAEEKLDDFGLSRPEAQELLKPAQDLVHVYRYFWQNQSDGLALFITTGYMKYYRLPISFKKLLVIADRFHLKPLLPLLSKNGHFYVLALSQNKIRLMEGSLSNIDEVELDDIPTSLREALLFDDPERQLQFHTGTSTPGNQGARPAIFHGQGAIEGDSKTDLLRYFQQVDNGLMEILAGEQSPLILVGVDYLLPIYRQANNYPNLAEESIKGNPDELNAVELHKQAWEIVEPIFGEEQREAIKRYQELSGSGSKLASSSLNKIIPAAFYGQVDTLFVALDIRLWGKFDPQKGIVEQHQEYEPGDHDLLDLAAMKTLLNGGTVYAVGLDKTPGKTPLAAIYRYS